MPFIKQVIERCRKIIKVENNKKTNIVLIARKTFKLRNLESKRQK